MEKLELTENHGELIAVLLAAGVNALRDELTSGQKTSAIIVADAFRRTGVFTVEFKDSE